MALITFQLNLNACEFENETQIFGSFENNNNKSSNVGESDGEKNKLEDSSNDEIIPKVGSKKRNRKISSSDEENENTTGKKKRELKKPKMDDTGKMGKMFLERFLDPDTGKKFVYIKHDITVPYTTWQEWTLSKTDSLFCKRMLNYFYTPDELTTRCVNEAKLVLTPNRRHQRKEISPRKSDAIESALRYYCKKKGAKNEAELIKRLSKKNSYITEEINKHLKKVKVSMKNEEIKHI